MRKDFYKSQADTMTLAQAVEAAEYGETEAASANSHDELDEMCDVDNVEWNAPPHFTEPQIWLAQTIMLRKLEKQTGRA